MAQNSCSYTFRGPDGENVVLRGMAAIKAFLASGGLEYLRAPKVRQSRARDVTQTLEFEKWFGDSKVPAIGNTGAFATDNPDITRSAERYTETDNFKRWFSDSVMTESGKPGGTPLKLYHGGFPLMDQKPGKAVPKASTRGALGYGFYMTPDDGRAQTYAGESGGWGRPDGKVTALYARLQNPLVIEHDDKQDPVITGLVSTGMPRDKAIKKVEKANEEYGWTGKELMSAATKAGYDGVVLKRDGKISEVVTYQPTQVKSADGNDGSFSWNPDIRKSAERPWYSQLERAIEGVPARLDNQSAVQWSQWLKANAPKLGVSDDEIQSSGASIYLRAVLGKISKADILGYLDWAAEVRASGVDEPRRVIEEAKNFFGGWKPPRETLNAVVNSGVISALDNDQVAEAVVELIPVDVMNVLADQGFTAKKLARKPEVLINDLPADARLAVANGVADALSQAGALLRAGLNSARQAGLDFEVLPALRARDLQSVVAARLLLPELVPVGLQVLSGGDRVRLAGARSSAVDGSVSALRVGGERGAAVAADFAEFHRESVALLGGDVPKSAITDAMREKAAGGMPLFSRERANTPEFKAWFGDSKVVNEDGTPMVMYHGTSRGGFTEFDRNKTLEWRSPSMDTVGSWFSNNPSEDGGAGMYAAGGESTIYPVHLSIQKPKVYSTFQDFLRHMHKAAGRPMPESAQGRGSTEELRAELKADGYDGIEFEQTANESLMQDIQEMQDAVRRAKDEEFSVKRADRQPYTQKRERLEQTLKSMRKEMDEFGSSTELDKQRVFIAFEPEQIKSVFNQRPTQSPDILRSAERTLTPEFKRWFGESKVVDAQGRPLVVYHGTPNDFKAFRGGAYFTADPDYANNTAAITAEAYDGSAAVMPVYLSIKNPAIRDVDFLEWIGYDGEKQAELESQGFDGVMTPDKSEIYPFRPEQIKSAIGNDGSFDDNDPNILSSAARAWEAPGASKFDDLVYKMQDRQVDLKRIIEGVKSAGGEIRNDIDTYLQEELFHGRAAKRTEDFVSKELQPLVDEMAKRGLTIEDLDQYLHARHAPEANRLIAERNPDTPGLQDGGSGLDTAFAQAYMADLTADKRDHLAAAAAMVDKMLAKTRKLVVDYELEGKDTVDGWGEMFDHYVPLMREDDGDAPQRLGTGQGFSIKGREVKSRTGSTKKVVDILANIAMQRERTIVRGEKNRVAQSLVGLAQANPNKEFWTVDLTPTTPTFDPKKGVVVQRPDPMFKARPNVVVAKIREEDGSVKEHAVIFSEKDGRALRTAVAMKNLDAAQLEGLMGASASITRYFAAINTQFNPVFGVVNLVRDVQGAMINLGTTELAGKQRDVAKNTLSALRGIYSDARAVRRGKSAASAWADLWEDFQDVGGQTGFRQLFATSNDRAEAIQKALDPDAWMDSKLGKIFTANGTLRVPLAVAMKGARWIFDWLSDYNLAMENGIRLATYKAGLDNGMSKERAASLAKNLTVNFNRRGQIGQQAGAVYAFFNASMQGTARLGQVLFDMEPGKPKTMRLSSLGKKVVYGGITLGSMQALALAAAGFDDNDPPDFLRERALIIPTGGKAYISIPMPLGFHVIPGVGRMTTEWALGGFKDTPERVVKMLGMFADTFNPIGNAGLSMQTLAPTALDPLVALTENRDWQGRPIAKESYNRATPGTALSRDTDTTWARLIAEAVNAATGGNEYVAGAISPAPSQIDYLIGQVTGGVGRELSKVEQTAKTAVTGEELPLYKVPLVGRFVGNAGSQASEGNAFYANSESLNKLETEIKGLQKDGKMAEAAALRASRPDAYLMAQANLAERQISKLRKQKSELVRGDAPRERVRAIEEQITARMAALNRAAGALREKAGD